MQIRRHALLDHFRMAHAGDAVGQHAGKRQPRTEMREPVGDRAHRLRDALGIDHRQHRHAQQLGQIGAARRAVEQAHHAFDQDQIGVQRGFIHQPPAFGRAGQPQIELIHGMAAGTLQNHRIEEIRPGLEHPDCAPLIRMKTRQRRRHGGLAVIGRGRADEQRGAAAQSGRHIQNSTPFCALMPCVWYGCLSGRISLTRSASSISCSGAWRPVTTMCSISRRLANTSSTSASSRY